MGQPKPTFDKLWSHYPTGLHDFGTDGRIINNPAYDGATCALRLSAALQYTVPGFLAQFAAFSRGGYPTAVDLRGRPGHYHRVRFAFVRGAPALARYLNSHYVGWLHRILRGRPEAENVGSQGIIFWDTTVGMPHIDLWDPVMRALPTIHHVGKHDVGYSMLWVPPAGHVRHAWFWQLDRGAAVSPPPAPQPLQSV